MLNTYQNHLFPINRSDDYRNNHKTIKALRESVPKKYTTDKDLAKAAKVSISTIKRKKKKLRESGLFTTELVRNKRNGKILGCRVVSIETLEEGVTVSGFLKGTSAKKRLNLDWSKKKPLNNPVYTQNEPREMSLCHISKKESPNGVLKAPKAQRAICAIDKKFDELIIFQSEKVPELKITDKELDKLSKGFNLDRKIVKKHVEDDLLQVEKEIIEIKREYRVPVAVLRARIKQTLTIAKPIYENEGQLFTRVEREGRNKSSPKFDHDLEAKKILEHEIRMTKIRADKALQMSRSYAPIT